MTDAPPSPEDLMRLSDGQRILLVVRAAERALERWPESASSASKAVAAEALAWARAVADAPVGSQQDEADALLRSLHTLSLPDAVTSSIRRAAEACVEAASDPYLWECSAQRTYWLASNLDLSHAVRAGVPIADLWSDYDALLR